MTINDPTKSCGFFDYLETGATVQNVRLENAFLNATGGSDYSFSQALLVGWTYPDVNYAPENQVTIANCSTSGTIQLQNPVGSMNVDGIVGLAQRQTTIAGCSSTATISVTGTADRSCFIGGIAGYLSSSADLAIHLDDCYFAGTITTDVPDSIVGDIFGARWASQTNGLLTISSCHSANSSITSNNASTAVALIGSDWAQHDATWDTGQPAISNCFWQESDQMGVAKVERNGSVTFPTDQSQFGSPVTDFSDPALVEKLNAGADNTWAMGVNDYPVLAWQTDLALADYSGVDAALATIPADLSLYTAESAAAVTTARDAVDRTLTADQQTQVDDMAAAIEAAVSALEKLANYDAVDAAVAKANALDRSRYTEETLAKLDAAVAAVVRGYGESRQDEVDDMAATIEAALAALELAPAPEKDPVAETLPATGDATLIAAIGCCGAGMSATAIGLFARKRR